MLKYLRWTRFRRTLAAVMALTTAGTGMVLGATSATADDLVTSYKVINDCLNGYQFNCTSKVSSVGLAYLGRYEVVSVNDPFYYNCTQSDSQRRFDYMQMIGEENSIGVEVGGEITPGGFLGEVIAGIKLHMSTTYQHAWQIQNTTGDATTVTVKSGSVGWLERAQLVQDVTTTYTITYPQPINGQSTYTATDTWKVPVVDGTDGKYSALVGRTRVMSAWEQQNICHWNVPLPPPPNNYPPTPVIPVAPKAFGARTLPPGWWTEGTLTRLVMQYDGNLVLYRKRDGVALWSTHTEGHGGAYAVMQTDGNLVVYTASGKYPIYPWGVSPYETPTRALWSIHTENNPGAWAIMQNDGNFVVYSSYGGPGKGGALWATGTNNTAK
ncbi:hypothetical protein [Streptomyces sp. NPDC048191]|uniref:hypothetical protein n=1 Tax=Streptomyces sp. NPDC048191 TaxID=3155484 RepID=UPI0033F1D938